MKHVVISRTDAYWTPVRVTINGKIYPDEWSGYSKVMIGDGYMDLFRPEGSTGDGLTGHRPAARILFDTFVVESEAGQRVEHYHIKPYKADV